MFLFTKYIKNYNIVSNLIRLYVYIYFIFIVVLAFNNNITMNRSSCELPKQASSPQDLTFKFQCKQIVRKINNEISKSELSLLNGKKKITQRSL